MVCRRRKSVVIWLFGLNHFRKLQMQGRRVAVKDDPNLGIVMCALRKIQQTLFSTWVSQNIRIDHGFE
ncbi:hypothetical protein BC938DRAFT_473853 [Jimgerdemannia flammicorona]|uniref:Uncharacterized protein n=1 Tax=Jimgerdemannia flammicorona TaxID=994334 RepID=A0A433Q3N0_9FUNG|nr:hypothetical protein BC938DRAFT_473853 [Jimgerdemannia flammicorona]